MKYVAGLLLALGAHAQLSSTVSLNNGVRLEVSTDLGHPTGEEKITVEMVRASGDSFYRILRDQNHLAVFAYELEVTLLPDGSALRATAKPAMQEFAARFPDADAGKPVPSLSSTQEIGPLASGQSASVPLFEIPGMGLNVVEHVRVRFGASEGSGALRLAGVRVFANGTPIAGPAPGSVAGRYAAMYIPGRGGFFFSTEPVPGRAFVKAGTSEGTRMRFTVDNVEYEVRASVAIQGVGGEVWVLHDAGYKPAGNWTTDPQRAERDQFFVAASDSLGWWLP